MIASAADESKPCSLKQKIMTNSKKNQEHFSRVIQSLPRQNIANLIDFIQATYPDFFDEDNFNEYAMDSLANNAIKSQYPLDKDSETKRKLSPKIHSELTQKLMQILSKLQPEKKKRIENAVLHFAKVESKGFTFFYRANYHEESNKNKSYESYVEEQRKHLNRKIDDKVKVYLDTKFWIGFRNIELGEESTTEWEQLYQALSNLVENEKACCPLSTVMLVELLKQSDPRTKLATARVMDRLSCGYTLRFCFDMIAEELYLFCKQQLEENSSKKKKISFDYSGFILGVPKIKFRNELKGISEESIDKAFFDWFTQMDLTDLTEFIHQNKSAANYVTAAYKRELETLKTELNKRKKATEKGLSYKDFHARAISEIMSTYKPLLRDSLTKLYIEKQNSEICSDTKTTVSLSEVEYFQEVIAAVLKNGTHKGSLPMLDVLSRIDAAVSSQENRKLKPNDFDDFRHAAAAFSAFDIFFTEKSLKHLLTTKPSSSSASDLASVYGVTVVCQPKEAIELLLKIDHLPSN